MSAAGFAYGAAVAIVRLDDIVVIAKVDGFAWLERFLCVGGSESLHDSGLFSVVAHVYSRTPLTQYYPLQLARRNFRQAHRQWRCRRHGLAAGKGNILDINWTEPLPNAGKAAGAEYPGLF